MYYKWGKRTGSAEKANYKEIHSAVIGYLTAEWNVNTAVLLERSPELFFKGTTTLLKFPSTLPQVLISWLHYDLLV